MATLVTRINAGINFVADLIGYTIRINYFLGEALFTLLSWAFGHVSTGTRALLAVIKVALFDFGQFVEDVGGVVSSTLAALECLTNFIAQFVYDMFFAFLSALASFVAVVLGVGSSVYVTISTILAAGKHIVQVGGKSLVLLAQTIPLGIAHGAHQVASLIVDGQLYIRQTIHSFLFGAVGCLVNQYQNAKYVFKGLPGETYLGLLLLVVILMSFNYAVQLLFINRRVILRSAHMAAVHVLAAIRHTAAAFSRNSTANDNNNNNNGRLVGRRSLESDSESSPSSSFETASYNLRQRKPSQRGTRASRIESIRQQLQKEKESRLCVICQERTRCVVLLPCRHFSFCTTCINQAIKYQHYCPLCRQDIEEVVPVYQ